MGSCVLAVGIIDCVSGVGKFGEIANGIVLVGVRIAGGFCGGCQSIEVIIAEVLRFTQQIVGDIEDIADFVIGISGVKDSTGLNSAGYNGFCGSCSTPFIEPETSKFSSQLSA